jgi:hypothetical protein
MSTASSYKARYWACGRLRAARRSSASLIAGTNRTFAPSYARSTQLASNTRLRSKSKRALMWNHVSIPSRPVDNFLERDEGRVHLPRSWTGRRWRVGQALEELLDRCRAFFDRGALAIRERDLDQHALEVYQDVLPA